MLITICKNRKIIRIKTNTYIYIIIIDYYALINSEEILQRKFLFVCFCHEIYFILLN